MNNIFVFWDNFIKFIHNVLYSSFIFWSLIICFIENTHVTKFWYYNEGKYLLAIVKKYFDNCAHCYYQGENLQYINFYTHALISKNDAIASSWTGKCFSIKDSSNNEWTPPKPAPIIKTDKLSNE